MSVVSHFLMDSPVGTLTLVSTDGVLSGLYMPEHLRGPKLETLGFRVQSGFDQVREELAEYFDSRRKEFTFVIAPVGTMFQKRVWGLLAKIPYGETQTYAHLSKELGNERAIRAVGLANGRNPISIVIPCHRVVGSDGSLSGYAGGLERKEMLLHLEGAKISNQISLL
jgi:methylated-DNA-[protein]-cysteine S-methyltransferase